MALAVDPGQRHLEAVKLPPLIVASHTLHEALDTTTPGGRLVFHVFAALAEFIREPIVEGTNEGLAAAGLSTS
ncbi:recombinase family protein [Nocardia tengchongensis]